MIKRPITARATKAANINKLLVCCLHGEQGPHLGNKANQRIDQPAQKAAHMSSRVSVSTQSGPARGCRVRMTPHLDRELMAD